MSQSYDQTETNILHIAAFFFFFFLFLILVLKDNSFINKLVEQRIKCDKNLLFCFFFLIFFYLYETEVPDKHILFPLFSLQQILPENFEQNITQIMTIMCLITDAFLCKQNKPKKKYIYIYIYI